MIQPYLDILPKKAPLFITVTQTILLVITLVIKENRESIDLRDGKFPATERHRGSERTDGEIRVHRSG